MLNKYHEAPGQPPVLFDPNYNWRALVDNENTAMVRKALRTVLKILTDYGRDGYVSERGYFVSSQDKLMQEALHQEHVLRVAGQLASENTGAITPGMLANYFTTGWRSRGTQNYEPDMSYVDWVYQQTMTDEVEKRDEWDFSPEFVRIDQYGQVKYGSFSYDTTFMANYEYGSGIPIKQTWFETNKFGIKMESLAPKFRYAYFHELLATYIYTTLQAGITGTITQTQNVIRDLNAAKAYMKRKTNNFDKTPWANARMRIIAPPEMEWILTGAAAMSYNLLSRERVTEMPPVTYTTLLPAGFVCYLVIDNWERNELGVRVPYSVYGTADDIDTFAKKIAYRGCWGFQMDTNSGIKLTFDPADAGFIIGGPIGTVDVTPT